MHFLYSLALTLVSQDSLEHGLPPLALAARLLAVLLSTYLYPLLWKVGSSLLPVLGLFPNMEGPQGGWLVLSAEHATLDPGVVSLNPTLGIEITLWKNNKKERKKSRGVWVALWLSFQLLV